VSPAHYAAFVVGASLRTRFKKIGTPDRSKIGQYLTQRWIAT
jgi:hypothetical protein